MFTLCTLNKVLEHSNKKPYFAMEKKCFFQSLPHCLAWKWFSQHVQNVSNPAEATKAKTIPDTKKNEGFNQSTCKDDSVQHSSAAVQAP
jgi:hypothetical protein